MARPDWAADAKAAGRTLYKPKSAKKQTKPKADKPKDSAKD